MILEETRATAGIPSIVVATVYGRTGGDRYVSYPTQEVPDILKPAWGAVFRTEDSAIAALARRLLTLIHNRIVFLQRVGYDFAHIPPLRAFRVGDGSLLFEWIFDELRIGFSIEPQQSESSWYIVSSKEPIQMSTYGYLSSVNLADLVHLLLDLILYTS